jgi:uncharacterized protein YndB with AHSA1/START domain
MRWLCGWQKAPTKRKETRMNDLSLLQGPNDLLLVRQLKAPRALVWRCWTEPDLLVQWFCPKPWFVSDVEIDLVPGGKFNSTICGPDGERMPGEGSFLEIIPGEKLVFTDILGAGWRPLETGLGFTAAISLRDMEGGGTVYTVLARHRNPADRDKHAEMGFEAGWGTAASQLDEVALTLV